MSLTCRSRRRRTRRSPYQPARGTRKEPSIAPDAAERASTGPEYTYLTIPQAAEARSCLGIALAGLAARAEVSVGGLEEAISKLEDAHSIGGHTSYRFVLEEGKILAQVQQYGQEQTGAEDDGADAFWHTLVEMVS